MQFFILLIGTLVFTFYQFHPPPVFFNKVEVSRVEKSTNAESLYQLQAQYKSVHEKKRNYVNQFVNAVHSNNQSQEKEAAFLLQAAEKEAKEIRNTVITLIKKENKAADINDTNYIFLNFVTTYLPKGLVGLLIAIIFLASMGSMASGLNSLASTTVVDIYKRLINKGASDSDCFRVSRWLTIGWGAFCILVALYAGKLGNLIEVVNILGSLFYGTILGVFVVAFYLKQVNGTSVFYAALLAEIIVVVAWLMELTAFLWLNVIGCLLVMLFSLVLQKTLERK